VAGGITDAEKDGFVLGFGFISGLLAPREPIDRVFSVKEQVGGFFVYQAVAHFL
jgi:hypothetical protein